MNINDLPDDCLLSIFGTFDDLKHLICCFKVCARWRTLLSFRLNKIKYLIAYGKQHEFVSNSLGLNLFNRSLSNDFTGEKQLFVLSDLIQNCRIAVICFNNVTLSSLVQQNASRRMNTNPVSNSHPLRCTICAFGEGQEIFELNLVCIEMLATDNIEKFTEKADSIRECRQLYIHPQNPNCFNKLANLCPNLERIHMKHTREINDKSSLTLSKLKILEIDMTLHSEDFYIGFNLTNLCPNLESAYFVVDSSSFHVDDYHEHHNLNDFVIEFMGADKVPRNLMKKLWIKYPKIKHLALRTTESCQILSDDHIEDLIVMLPELILLDLRYASGITQASVDLVNKIVEKYGRSIKIYCKWDVNQNGQSWPDPSNERAQIGQGFDFMENCFFKSFAHLPYFLEPNKPLSSSEILLSFHKQ